MEVNSFTHKCLRMLNPCCDLIFSQRLVLSYAMICHIMQGRKVTASVTPELSTVHQSPACITFLGIASSERIDRFEDSLLQALLDFRSIYTFADV